MDCGVLCSPRAPREWHQTQARQWHLWGIIEAASEKLMFLRDHRSSCRKATFLKIFHFLRACPGGDELVGHVFFWSACASWSKEAGTGLPQLVSAVLFWAYALTCEASTCLQCSTHGCKVVHMDAMSTHGCNAYTWMQCSTHACNVVHMLAM